MKYLNRIENLRKKVKDLYDSRNPNREDWADWLGAHHIFVVAEYADKIARRYGGDSELSSAAGMLHDIADTEMSRFNPRHEERSLEIARQLLVATGFSKDEIKVVVDDAIQFHGCHDDTRSTSLEGKVMAAADALAHLQADFYKHAFEEKSKQSSLSEIKKWALPKLERDFNNKIAFVEIHNEAQEAYMKWSKFFSELV